MRVLWRPQFLDVRTVPSPFSGLGRSSLKKQFTSPVAPRDITGAGLGAVANGGRSTQLFNLDGGSTLHLSDLTLAHGNASTGDGGAIYVGQSTVSLTGNMSFISNSAGFYGGAIYSQNSTVSWDGDGTEFINNSAGFHGGAIYAQNSSVSWDVYLQLCWRSWRRNWRWVADRVVLEWRRHGVQRQLRWCSWRCTLQR